MISLSEALRTNRLEEFIAEQEAAGVPSADIKEFEKLAARVIKHTPPANRTSLHLAMIRPEGELI